jgi:TolB-like protein
MLGICDRAKGFAEVFQPGESHPSTATAVKSRRSVAVLRFKNLSGKTEQDWLSTALAEMLTTELASSS